jgi:hypothetical protein
MTAKQLATRISKSGIKFDKMILEYPDSANGGWVHIQIAKMGGSPRREVYTIKTGTGYLPGIL